MQQVNLPTSKPTSDGAHKSSNNGLPKPARQNSQPSGNRNNLPNYGPTKDHNNSGKSFGGGLPVRDTSQGKTTSPWGMPGGGNNQGGAMLDDPWGGSDWDDPWGGGNQQNKQSKKLSPQERVELIEKLYQDVLNRKPDTRDINYYKYSTLGEEEMQKQLITGKEHKQLIADGREYKQMKGRAEQAETRVKMLESQIKDQVVEFKQLSELLQEKNRYINELRAQSNNPYNLTNSTPHMPGNTHYGHEQTQPQTTAPIQQPQPVQSNPPQTIPTPVRTFDQQGNPVSQPQQYPIQQGNNLQFSAPAPHNGQQPRKERKGFLNKIKSIITV